MKSVGLEFDTIFKRNKLDDGTLVDDMPLWKEIVVSKNLNNNINSSITTERERSS